jgi:hypothetical protein
VEQPKPLTDVDRANIDKTKAQTILALAQAAAAAGDTAVNHAKRDAIAMEVDQYLNERGHAGPISAPFSPPNPAEPTPGPMDLPTLGQPHPGGGQAPGVGAAPGLPAIQPAQPLAPTGGGPLDGLQHLPPEVLQQLLAALQGGGAGAPSPMQR